MLHTARNSVQYTTEYWIQTVYHLSYRTQALARACVQLYYLHAYTEYISHFLLIVVYKYIHKYIVVYKYIHKYM